MPKSSVKDNHHHRHHNQQHNTSNLSINGLDNSNHVVINGSNNNTPHLQHKDDGKRLKRKLRLQEMRNTLMSNKLTELKTALSNKKRQLRISEKRIKDEEKKRMGEEKKMKDMEKEFQRLRRENDQIKDQINLNSNQTIESISLTLSPQQSQALTSNPSTSSPLQPSISSSTSGPNSNKRNKKNKRNKRMAPSNVDDSPQATAQASKSLVNHASSPVVISPSNNGIGTKPAASSSSKDLKVNEGASCSGVNTSVISSSSSQIISVDSSQNSNILMNCNASAHPPGSTKLEDLFENELMCPICHELYIKPMALNCTHIFCHYCIHQWDVKAHKCPICRNHILYKTPQNVLENVIDKVVSTMDEDSKKRRADVIKDRPVPPESDRPSRGEGYRCERMIAALRDEFRNYDDYGHQSTDSYSDSESYLDSSLPAYGAFGDRSTSDMNSDLDERDMLPFPSDYEYNGYDDEYFASDQDDDDDDYEDSTDDSVDEYISDGDDPYELHLHPDYNEDGQNYSNSDSESWVNALANNEWGNENSPITIDSDSEESVAFYGQHSGDNSYYYGRSPYFNRDDVDDEDEDEDEEEEEDDDDEDDEEEEEDVENEGDEDVDEDDEDDEVDEEGEDDEDDEEVYGSEDEDVDGVDYYDEEDDEGSMADSDFNESDSSPWESMDVTDSDSDL